VFGRKPDIAKSWRCTDPKRSRRSLSSANTPEQQSCCSNGNIGVHC